MSKAKGGESNRVRKEERNDRVWYIIKNVYIRHTYLEQRDSEGKQYQYTSVSMM